MSIRRMRTLLVFLMVAAAIAKALAELRPKAAPDVTRHPTVDGGNRAPSPAQDPYQAPVVDPAAIDADLAPVSTLEVPERTDTLTTTTPAASAPEPVADRTWVPSIKGICPAGYLIKANLDSGIFHEPGQLSYDRTTPDRCYPNAQAALDDGLRAAKR